MPTLTRAEAAERASVVDVETYHVDLDLTGDGGTFRSRTVVRFRARPGAATFLEFEPVEVASMTLNGQPVPAGAADGARLALSGLAESNELVVDATMRYSNNGEGLHRYVDPADGAVYLYQHLFINNAGRVLPSFDQPDLKASFRVSVTAPAEWTVATNGQLVSRDGGRWEFAATERISTYLATLIAGPWHTRVDEHDGIPLALFTRAALAEQLDAQAPEIFEITKQCLDRFHEMFRIRYPFGHYQQAFAPEFNFGAMEYPGLVVFRDELVPRSTMTDTEREYRASVIAHEMAHQWFGDLVTMAWWDDLWLNESFAEYLGSRVAAEATRWTGTWTTFALHRKAWGLRADQRPSTHPVAPAEVADTDQALMNFDGISYAKGASVLKQLVAWLGDEAFLAGVNAHFAAHAFGNATLADLLGALAEAGGRDLSGWAELWLRRAQVNTLRAEVRRDGERYAEVAVVQTAPEGFGTLRPHRIGIGLYDHLDGAVVRRELIEAELDASGRTELPALAGKKAADLLLLNDGDLAYGKIRLDDDSAAAIPLLLPLLTDSLARAVIWASTLDAVVDGERPVAELVTLVLAALPVETETVIVEDVLRATRGLVDRYATAAARPAALELVAQAADRLLAASPAGGSRQLAAARGLIGATVDTARLDGWLAGAGVPAGLVVDADLRWLIRYRLAVLGVAGPAEIDAELAADRSANGEQWAARCRAALPDPAAKEAAWAAIVGDATLSNRLVELTALGFWQAEQRELLEPYVERYFAEMPGMMRIRSGMSAEKISVAAFPAVMVSERARELAAGLLAEPELNPILRRVVQDNDDDMRRALLARGLGG
ncbi:aminopeptidase N [Actinoplanes octamycinicus]|uniref:Aminopeptidase N n=1 Tax=Actinoplanes octamycinicus TaxID=135948 RepID=A0A7W7GW90_9ACTN|nr:aminopeptidase N [Actinoplanes octamycinicus]MBB4739435.1 aminopeptidase N [Actinoplanes octamycinicus]GIE54620.1 aminopeptidase [Actinoplanes octamycinicus]